MNQKNLIVLFYLNRAKTNQKGTCPIYCRITYLKKRKQFSTGELINPTDWNSKLQKSISNTSSSQQLNAQLELIETDIKRIYLKLQLRNLDITVNDIINEYKGLCVDNEISTIMHFDHFLARRQNLIGIDIQQSTWDKLYYAFEQWKEFIKWKFGKHDLALGKLNLQCLIDFEYYLKTERRQKQITINKTIQRVRKPIREAVSAGYLEIDPFVLFKFKRVLKEVVFLSTDELALLENHSFSQTRLQLVKDLFIFCCYTGLGYYEMSNLKDEHIINGFDGNEWIQMKRQKTNKIISVPLLPKAIELINKYKSNSDCIFPKISNQKFNSYLKEISDIIGINKRISHHTGRKTFASTILLYNDVPIEIVSELLGHSSIKITQDYYGKISNKKVSQIMTILATKVNQKRR